ncbi:hypothetical protein KAR28_00625 [Candidatus Parcubacteria bacterium]|nr:hypothetical protein [Candidatus Parcubacteria bacterium]
MTNQKVDKLEDFSATKFKENVSENFFWKNTHKEFRTLMDEDIINHEVYEYIKEQALSSKITENNLFKHLQKDLKLKYDDVRKIIDALKEKLMPASEDNTNEKELEERRNIINAIIASAREKE